MKLPLWFQVPVLAFVTFGFTPAGCPDPTLPRPAEVTHDAVRWPVLPDGTMKVEEKGWRQGLQVPAKFARAADPAAFSEVVLRDEPRSWLESLRRREYLSFADTGAIYSGK